MRPTLTVPLEPFLLQAKPENLEVDLKRIAVIVVDMQNAFVSEGGMADLQGGDISSRQKTIAPINKIANTARAKGCKVIDTVHLYSPDFREAGEPNSPNGLKGFYVF